MTRTMTFLATLAATALFSTLAPAEDWPQWMGPKRDSVWRETGVVEKFPESGLKVKWRTPIAGGYSGPAVAGGRVYVSDFVHIKGDAKNSPSVRNKIEGTERLLCLNEADGSILWKHEYDCSYRISYPDGPRATPTVDGSHVYTLGAQGHLFCLNAKTGAVLWTKDLGQEYDTEAPLWGFCGHPLVDGDKLICLVGGKGSVAVAFDKTTGKELWRALSAKEPGYCPPTMITAGGTRQLLIWHAESMNSLDPESGKVYWSIPLAPQYGMSITAPRHSGEYLFAGGIGNVAALFKLDSDKPAAEVVWRGKGKTAVYCSNSTPFIDGDVLYGVGCKGGQLRGVDLKSGTRLWETYAATTGTRPAGQATAFLVKHEDRFFLFNEKGDLILARLSREGYEEISRFHVLEPTQESFGRDVIWSHPAFANKCVYARNSKEIVCVSLADE